jgi:long-subunit acyl-CoA synthetase (AMP-forming)
MLGDSNFSNAEIFDLLPAPPEAKANEINTLYEALQLYQIGNFRAADDNIRVEEDGEVTVATPCMMQGYIGDQPMFDRDRFFTGDLGWFDEKGRLHLKGRKKDVLVMADGTKIFCPEYEEDLERLTGLPDLGLSMKDGHAVLVAGSLSNDPAIEANIRGKLLKTVGNYNKKLQRSQQIYDVIVRADSLPRTATGKIKRYELQEQINK